jgi:hypothetical protein
MRKSDYALMYCILLEMILVQIRISADHLIQNIRVPFPSKRESRTQESTPLDSCWSSSRWKSAQE